LQLKKDYFEQLRLAEQETARAQFEFDLEFTAQTEAEKQALQIAYAQQSLDIERRYAEESTAITEALTEAEIARYETAQSIFAGLAGLFEENTIAYKAFATVEAVISTYLAANKALASAPPPFGAILAGITVAQGLLNVAKINGVKFANGGLMQFANGGKMGVFGGKPHSQGGTKGYFEDGTMVEVEAGEAWAVVNKQNTPMLKQLSDINSFGGNGVAFMQEGGLFGNEVASIGQGIITSANFNELVMQAMKNQPPIYTEITEIIRYLDKNQLTERIANQ